MSVTSTREHAGAQQRLATVREALLRLHKALLDSERASYEKAFGRIASSYQFLQLLTTDPWFAWLQPVTQLVAAMDELLDAEAPLTASGVDAWWPAPSCCWSRRWTAKAFHGITTKRCSATRTWCSPTRKPPGHSADKRKVRKRKIEIPPAQKNGWRDSSLRRESAFTVDIAGPAWLG